MGEIARSIDQVIKLGFADLLKVRGFKKTGRNWHRADGENWLIVNVQASSSNSGKNGKFVVNLGVYVAAVAALAGKVEMHGKPKEYESTIRERLGSLAYGEDHWWAIESGSNLDLISADLVEKMLSVGFPWLETHRDISHLAAALRNSPSLLSVSAAWLAGDKDEASRRLRGAIERRPAARERFSAWAINNGVAL
ncbi:MULTISPECIES: DUF4304 domain-containing protein [unclassified Rhizobium]|uniref:DUF4304 domain-containing protein n=1 Tax=unclassified Rhizobium TaxID=2613769 RepID=UPI0007EA3CB7|nr:MULTISPECIES: DUF4304 domain-containing protein [unclassified Rhizobium]ANM11344.1 hypothetical protein AMK05_CH02977 [Rhizobium sp. N324]OYD04948.1 hypothetical protein AMK08_CH102995 [Rhizobium sp. N4311]